MFRLPPAEEHKWEPNRHNPAFKHKVRQGSPGWITLPSMRAGYSWWFLFCSKKFYDSMLRFNRCTVFISSVGQLTTRCSQRFDPHTLSKMQLAARNLASQRGESSCRL
jgi:hypothetical protein